MHPKLIRFTAAWCKPCQRLAPLLEGMRPEFPGVDFEVIDIDQYPNLAAHYNVMSIPTLVIEVSGQVVKKWTGTVRIREVAAALREFSAE